MLVNVLGALAAAIKVDNMAKQIKCFLTEYPEGGKRWAGHEILAFDWTDAEAKAQIESRLSGRPIRVKGELIEVIEIPEDNIEDYRS